MTSEQSRKRYCSACGSEVPHGSAFCVRCGVAMGSSGIPPRSEAATAAQPGLVSPMPQTTSPKAATPGPNFDAAKTGLQTLRDRWAALPGRTRVIAAVAGSLAVVAVAALMILNTPERHIAVLLESVAARDPSVELSNAYGLAIDLQIAYSPAEMAFSTRSLEVTSTGSGQYVATWQLDAQRDGNVVDTVTNVLPIQKNAASGGGETWLVGRATDGFDLSKLLPTVSTLAEATKLVVDANAANATFGGGVRPVTLDVPPTADGPGGPPPPQLNPEPDHTLLDSCGSTTDTESVAAKVSTFYYVTPDQRLPVGSQVVEPAVTGTQSNGDLTEAQLLTQANAVIGEFSAAQTAGDVIAAMKLLSGADGLTESGLAASTVGTETALEVEPIDCPLRVYSIVTSNGRAMEFKGGMWHIDYAGQPIVAFSPSGTLSYSKGPLVLVIGQPIELLNYADATAPKLVVQISGGDYHYTSASSTWRAYWVIVTAVSRDGQALDADTYSWRCHINSDGQLPCLDTARAFVPPPTGSLEITVEFWSATESYGGCCVSLIARLATGTIIWRLSDAAPAPAPSATP